VFSCVSLSHLLSQNVSLQTDTPTTILPSLSTNYINPTGWQCYWHFSPPTLFLTQLCIGTTCFLLDYRPLKIGPTEGPATLVRHYRYSPHKNPEVCTSHLHKNHLSRSHNSVSFNIFMAAVIQIMDIFQAGTPCSELLLQYCQTPPNSEHVPSPLPQSKVWLAKFPQTSQYNWHMSYHLNTSISTWTKPDTLNMALNIAPDTLNMALNITHAVTG
jgi:hypothetical protein